MILALLGTEHDWIMAHRYYKINQTKGHDTGSIGYGT